MCEFGSPTLLPVTPTRVGTTSRFQKFDRDASVHPHARGDDVGCICGSGGRNRFTPTRVGTTLKFSLIFLDAHQH